TNAPCLPGNRWPRPLCPLPPPPSDRRNRIRSASEDQRRRTGRSVPVPTNSETGGWSPPPTRTRRTDASSSTSRGTSSAESPAYRDTLRETRFFRSIAFRPQAVYTGAQPLFRKGWCTVPFVPEIWREVPRSSPATPDTAAQTLSPPPSLSPLKPMICFARSLFL